MLVATDNVSTRSRSRLIGRDTVTIGADVFRKVDSEQRATDGSRDQAANKIPKIKIHMIPHNNHTERFANLFISGQQLKVVQRISFDRTV